MAKNKSRGLLAILPSLWGAQSRMANSCLLQNMAILAILLCRWVNRMARTVTIHSGRRCAITAEGAFTQLW
jgi:hypothetical protein